MKSPSLWKSIVNAAILLSLPAAAAADTNSSSGFEAVQHNLGVLQTFVIGDQTPQTPQEIIARVIGIALGLIGIVFVILMIYGGYLWMTARGNEEQVNKARDLIIQSIIGAVIVFLAYFVTAFVVQRVGEAVFEPIFY
ncbi:MAG: pilin [Patescibacteria group bacterium]|jgi:hypothetical protein